MRTFFTKWSCIVTLGMILSGCVPADVDIPKFHAPDIPAPDLSKLDQYGCLKKESEQTFSSEALQNIFVIEDSVDVMDIEYLSCDKDKKVVHKEHGPVRDTYKRVQISAPQDLENVMSIEVENPRTCAKFRIETTEKYGENSLLPEVVQPSQGLRNGDLDLMATSSKTLAQFSDQIPVAENTNSVQIRYFGECLKYEEGKPQNPENCEKRKILATKDITVDLKLKKTEVPGTKQITCQKI